VLPESARTALANGHMPPKCPVCGSPVAREEGESRTVHGRTVFAAQRISRWLHFRFGAAP